MPERAERVVTSVVLLVAVIVLVGTVVHLVRKSVSEADEEARLRAVGVKVTAELDFASNTRNTGTPVMRATYVYEGVAHTVTLACDDCSDGDRVPVWVDPEDPAKYYMEDSSSAQEFSAFDVALSLLSGLSIATIGFILYAWRRRLSGPDPKRTVP